MKKKSKELDKISPALFEKLADMLVYCPEAQPVVTEFIDLLIEKKSLLNRSKSINQGIEPGWIPVLGPTAAGFIGFSEHNEPGEDHFSIMLKDIVHRASSIPLINSKTAKRKAKSDFSAGDLNLESDNIALVQINDPSGNNIPGGVTSFIDCCMVRERFKDAFAMRIDGGSMSPRIEDGDYVVLSPSVPAIEGAAAVVKLKNQIGLTCKIFRRQGDMLHLISLNEHFPAQKYPLDQLDRGFAVLYVFRF